MSKTSTWHGTREESGELLATVARNCECRIGPEGQRSSTCPVHQMLIDDQRALDGLLFARHIVGRLRFEEGLV